MPGKPAAQQATQGKAPGLSSTRTEPRVSLQQGWEIAAFWERPPGFIATPPAGLRRAFSPRHRSPLGKSLLEHSQAYLSTCSISRSRGGRRCRATVLHVTAPSIKPGIAPKTDVLAPSHLLQPFMRLPELLQQKKMKKKGVLERREVAKSSHRGDR